jgi:sRNA-binding regulator protein Hfq
MNNSIKSESEFFAAQIADGGQVAVFLTNGIKLLARISAEDRDCILLQGGGDARPSTTSLIMKSAIASVVPMTKVDARKSHVGDQTNNLATRSKKS